MTQKAHWDHPSWEFPIPASPPILNRNDFVPDVVPPLSIIV